MWETWSKNAIMSTIRDEKKIISSTLAVIPYAEFMFSYATWKKLTTPFLNQKWVFQPLPPLFSKKRPKKAGETEGGKIIFLSRERKMIFLPSLCSTFFFPGKEKWFFFPLFEFFYFSFPGKKKVVLALLAFFWPFLAFMAFETFTRLGNYL